jgi:hypothetical protein
MVDLPSFLKLLYWVCNIREGLWLQQCSFFHLVPPFWGMFTISCCEWTVSELQQTFPVFTHYCWFQDWTCHKKHWTTKVVCKDGLHCLFLCSDHSVQMRLQICSVIFGRVGPDLFKCTRGGGVYGLLVTLLERKY